MWNIRSPGRFVPGAALAALCCLIALTGVGCSGDDANPLSAREQQLVGTWRLDLGAVDEDDLAFTYTFRNDHTVRNRMGGAFLSRLRESEALQSADLGELADVDQIDGATVTWSGSWSLGGDSLRVLFDELEVHVLGRLPVIGEVSVPVYLEQLDGDRQAEVTYAYQISDERLVLRGAAASAGIASQTAEEQIASLDPLARAALEAASDALLETYRQSVANEFVYLRD